MAMSLPSAGGENAALSDINTTPLVDVMLVLLIIFLITIPVVNYSVPVKLPQERNQVRESDPADVVISVDAQGRIHWFDAPVSGTAELVDRLKAVAARTPQPAVHIRGDRGSPYEPVGRIVYACQRAGIVKVGFITEPPPRS